jgi:hypothetical protein
MDPIVFRSAFGGEKDLFENANNRSLGTRDCGCWGVSGVRVGFEHRLQGHQPATRSGRLQHRILQFSVRGTVLHQRPLRRDAQRRVCRPRSQRRRLGRLPSIRSDRTPADPRRGLRFDCAPVLTYSSTLRSGARRNLRPRRGFASGRPKGPSRDSRTKRRSRADGFSAGPRQLTRHVA